MNPGLCDPPPPPPLSSPGKQTRKRQKRIPRPLQLHSQVDPGLCEPLKKTDQKTAEAYTRTIIRPYGRLTISTIFSVKHRQCALIDVPFRTSEATNPSPAVKPVRRLAQGAYRRRTSLSSLLHSTRTPSTMCADRRERPVRALSIVSFCLSVCLSDPFPLCPLPFLLILSRLRMDMRNIYRDKN